MFQLRPDTRRGSSASSATSGIPVVTPPSHRGQALVEFALVLPMLLVLLLGIADFGRVFSAAITLEAAARNGAEAAAQEYVQLIRNSVSGTLTAADYAHLHDVALEKVCKETETLPNQAEIGGTCTMPLAAVCIHDDHDLAGCGAEADPSLTQCDGLNGAWNETDAGPDPLGSGALRYVEVRTCYRFTTLMNLSALHLPFGWGLSLGDIYLQKDREFTVACYPAAAGPCT
jgi:hypothetical protein